MLRNVLADTKEPLAPFYFGATMKKCELCGQDKADSIAANREGTWKVVCPCSDNSPYFYWIMKKDLKTKEQLDTWLKHLTQKTWFDKSQFMWAYRRLF